MIADTQQFFSVEKALENAKRQIFGFIRLKRTSSDESRILIV